MALLVAQKRKRSSNGARTVTMEPEGTELHVRIAVNTPDTPAGELTILDTIMIWKP